MSKKKNRGVRLKYEFIKANRKKHNIRTMCRLLDVAPSGFYAWLKKPNSDRAIEDKRLLKLIRASFAASQGVYGAPRVFLDLRDAGETCSKHRVARLMRENNIRAKAGYRTRRYVAGKPFELIPDLVQRKFEVSRPDHVWASDITYTRTWEGWLYLAIVMDLFSRKIVGWAKRSTMHRELVLDAVMKAIKTGRPKDTIIHSDQGSQYGSDDWRRFCRTNSLEPSMSRRGNCWDNAVAESFFSSLKKERIKKRIYNNRKIATDDVSDYIETFYNRTRRHQHLGGISPEANHSEESRSKIPWKVSFSDIRECIRTRRKIKFHYTDLRDKTSNRTIRPLSLVFFGPVWLVLGWCGTRKDFRNFRLDRMAELAIPGTTFKDEKGKTLKAYLAQCVT